MNLEQLRGFAEVVSVGNFTRAAENLHVAQPTLSRQISTLEHDLRVQLLHRTRGNITLTTAGERLLPVARRMLADAESARSAMAELAGLKRGRLRIGATPTLCASLVADVLAEFHPAYPGIDIEIVESGSRTLIEAVVEGTLDLALIVTSVSSPAAREVIELEHILAERLVVTSAADRPDPFDAAGPVTLEAVAAAPLIELPENYDLRAATDAAFAARGLSPNVVVSGGEMDASLRFAARGIGVVIVPAIVAAQHPSLRARAIDADELTRTVSIARRSDMTPAPASAALQRLIRQVAARVASASGDAELLGA